MASKDANSTLEDDRMSRISTLQFPMKLHVMLEESRKRGLEEIVCWSSSGGFRIYDKRRFESEIMPLYFKSKTHKSFQRTLNLWGFQTNHLGVIHHTFFRKDEPELCYEIIRVGSVKRKEQEDQELAAAEKAARDQATHQHPLQYGLSAPLSFAHTLNQGGVNGNQLMEKLFSVLSDRDLQSQTPIVQLYENLLGTSMEDILAKCFLMQLQQKESAMSRLVMQALQSKALPSSLLNASSSSSLASAVMAPAQLTANPSQQMQGDDEPEDFMQAAAARLARAQSGNLQEVEKKSPPLAIAEKSWVQPRSSPPLNALSRSSFEQKGLPQHHPQYISHSVVSPPPSMEDFHSILMLANRNKGNDRTTPSLSGGLSLLSQVSCKQPSVVKKRKIANEVLHVSRVPESKALMHESEPSSSAEVGGSPDAESPTSKRRRLDHPAHVVTQDNLREPADQGTLFPSRDSPTTISRSYSLASVSQRPQSRVTKHAPADARGLSFSQKSSLITLAWNDAQGSRSNGKY